MKLTDEELFELLTSDMSGTPEIMEGPEPAFGMDEDDLFQFIMHEASIETPLFEQEKREPAPWEVMGMEEYRKSLEPAEAGRGLLSMALGEGIRGNVEDTLEGEIPTDAYEMPENFLSRSWNILGGSYLRDHRAGQQERKKDKALIELSELTEAERTVLQDDEEEQFKKWYERFSEAQRIDKNPDDPRHFYDYRGYWKAMKEGRSHGGIDEASGEYHLPDEFKIGGHPTHPDKIKATEEEKALLDEGIKHAQAKFGGALGSMGAPQMDRREVLAGIANTQEFFEQHWKDLGNRMFDKVEIKQMDKKKGILHPDNVCAYYENALANAGFMIDMVAMSMTMNYLIPAGVVASVAEGTALVKKLQAGGKLAQFLAKKVPQFAQNLITTLPATWMEADTEGHDAYKAYIAEGGDPSSGKDIWKGVRAKNFLILLLSNSLEMTTAFPLPKQLKPLVGEVAGEAGERLAKSTLKQRVADLLGFPLRWAMTAPQEMGEELAQYAVQQDALGKEWHVSDPEAITAMGAAVFMTGGMAGIGTIARQSEIVGDMTGEEKMIVLGYAKAMHQDLENKERANALDPKEVPLLNELRNAFDQKDEDAMFDEVSNVINTGRILKRIRTPEGLKASQQYEGYVNSVRRLMQKVKLSNDAQAFAEDNSEFLKNITQDEYDFIFENAEMMAEYLEDSGKSEEFAEVLRQVVRRGDAITALALLDENLDLMAEITMRRNKISDLQRVYVPDTGDTGRKVGEVGDRILVHTGGIEGTTDEVKEIEKDKVRSFEEGDRVSFQTKPFGPVQEGTYIAREMGNETEEEVSQLYDDQGNPVYPEGKAVTERSGLYRVRDDQGNEHTVTDVDWVRGQHHELVREDYGQFPEVGKSQAVRASSTQRIKEETEAINARRKENIRKEQEVFKADSEHAGEDSLNGVMSSMSANPVTWKALKMVFGDAGKKSRNRDDFVNRVVNKLLKSKGVTRAMAVEAGRYAWDSKDAIDREGLNSKLQMPSNRIMTGWIGNKGSAGVDVYAYTMKAGQFNYTRVIDATAGSGASGMAFFEYGTKDGAHPELVLNDLDEINVLIQEMLKDPTRRESVKKEILNFQKEAQGIIDKFWADDLEVDGRRKFNEEVNKWWNSKKKDSSMSDAQKVAWMLIANDGSLGVGGAHAKEGELTGRNQRFTTGADANIPYQLKSGVIDRFDAVAKNAMSWGKSLERNKVTIQQGDMSDVLKNAEKGDLVIIDPPYANAKAYRVGGEDITNPAYAVKWIHTVLKDAVDRGVHVVYSNNDIVEIRKALKDIGLMTKRLQVPSQNDEGESQERAEVVGFNTLGASVQADDSMSFRESGFDEPHRNAEGRTPEEELAYRKEQEEKEEKIVEDERERIKKSNEKTAQKTAKSEGSEEEGESIPEETEVPPTGAGKVADSEGKEKPPVPTSEIADGITDFISKEADGGTTLVSLMELKKQTGLEESDIHRVMNVLEIAKVVGKPKNDVYPILSKGEELAGRIAKALEIMNELDKFDIGTESKESRGASEVLGVEEAESTTGEIDPCVEGLEPDSFMSLNMKGRAVQTDAVVSVMSRIIPNQIIFRDTANINGEVVPVFVIEGSIPRVHPLTGNISRTAGIYLVIGRNILFTHLNKDNMSDMPDMESRLPDDMWKRIRNAVDEHLTELKTKEELSPLGPFTKDIKLSYKHEDNGSTVLDILSGGEPSGYRLTSVPDPTGQYENEYRISTPSEQELYAGNDMTKAIKDLMIRYATERGNKFIFGKSISQEVRDATIDFANLLDVPNAFYIVHKNDIATKELESFGKTLLNAKYSTDKAFTGKRANGHISIVKTSGMNGDAMIVSIWLNPSENRSAKEEVGTLVHEFGHALEEMILDKSTGEQVAEVRDLIRMWEERAFEMTLEEFEKHMNMEIFTGLSAKEKKEMTLDEIIMGDMIDQFVNLEWALNGAEWFAQQFKAYQEKQSISAQPLIQRVYNAIREFFRAVLRMAKYRKLFVDPTLEEFFDAFMEDRVVLQSTLSEDAMDGNRAPEVAVPSMEYSPSKPISYDRTREVTKEERKRAGFRTDNPGGDWLTHVRERAQKLLEEESLYTGAVTMYAQPVMMSPADLIGIKGARGEEERLGLYGEENDRVMALADDMLKHGFDERSAPLVSIEFDGTPRIIEGNHRIRASYLAGMKKIPVWINYKAGSESILAPDHELHPDNITRKAMVLESVENPVSAQAVETYKEMRKGAYARPIVPEPKQSKLYREQHSQFGTLIDDTENFEPTAPLQVNNEPLFLFWGNEYDGNLLMEEKDTDTDWVKAHKRVYAKLGYKLSGGLLIENKDFARIEKLLIEELMEMGYDSVLIEDGDQSWSVGFDPNLYMNQRYYFSEDGIYSQIVDSEELSKAGTVLSQLLMADCKRTAIRLGFAPETTSENKTFETVKFWRENPEKARRFGGLRGLKRLKKSAEWLENMGISVRFFDHENPKIRGFAQMEPVGGFMKRALWININGNYGIEWALWHEAVHALFDGMFGNDGELKSGIDEMFSIFGIDMEAIKQSDYFQKLLNSTASGDMYEALIEVLADAFATFARDSNFMGRLKNTGVLSRIASWAMLKYSEASETLGSMFREEPDAFTRQISFNKTYMTTGLVRQIESWFRNVAELTGAGVGIESPFRPLDAIFYSPLEKWVLQHPARKFTASSLKSELEARAKSPKKGQPRIAMEELQFTRILDWLGEMSPKQKLTKQEVLNYVVDNIIQIYEERLFARTSDADIMVREYPKFSTYTMSSPLRGQGPRNYREWLIAIPNWQGDPYHSKKLKGDPFIANHWTHNVRNIVGHLRTYDIECADGSKHFFVDELQSDWHVQGVKHGFWERDLRARPEVKKSIFGINEELNRLYLDNSEWLMPVLNEMSAITLRKTGNPEFASNIIRVLDNPTRITEVGSLQSDIDYIIPKFKNSLAEIKETGTLAEILKDRDVPVETAEKVLSLIDDALGKVAKEEDRYLKIEDHLAHPEQALSDAPFVATEKWLELCMKRMMYQALKEGYDGFIWGNTQLHYERWGGQGDKTGFYDNVIPRIAKKLIKEYGLESDNVQYKIKGDNEVANALDDVDIGVANSGQYTIIANQVNTEVTESGLNRLLRRIASSDENINEDAGLYFRSLHLFPGDSNNYLDAFISAFASVVKHYDSQFYGDDAITNIVPNDIPTMDYIGDMMLGDGFLGGLQDLLDDTYLTPDLMHQAVSNGWEWDYFETRLIETGMMKPHNAELVCEFMRYAGYVFGEQPGDLAEDYLAIADPSVDEDGMWEILTKVREVMLSQIAWSAVELSTDPDTGQEGLYDYIRSHLNEKKTIFLGIKFPGEFRQTTVGKDILKQGLPMWSVDREEFERMRFDHLTKYGISIKDALADDPEQDIEQDEQVRPTVHKGKSVPLSRDKNRKSIKHPLPRPKRTYTRLADYIKYGDDERVTKQIKRLGMHDGSAYLMAWYHNQADGFYKVAFDELHALDVLQEMFLEKWRKEHPDEKYLPNDLAPYFHARTAKGTLKWLEKANRLFHDALRNIDYAESEDFEEFLVARRALEYYGHGLNPGLPEKYGTKDKCQEIVDKAPKKFSEVADDILSIYNHVMEETLVKTGIINESQYQAMREKWPHYVPFIHETDDVTAIDALVGGNMRKIAEIGMPVKRVKGAEEETEVEIRNPLEVMIKNMAVFQAIKVRNETAKAVRNIGKHKGFEWVARKIDKVSDTERTKMTLYENGVKEIYEVDSDIYEALKTMEADSTAKFWLTQLPVSIAETFKKGTTRWNPAFIVRNLLRDPFEVQRNSRVPVWVPPFTHTIRGLMMYFSKDPKIQKLLDEALEMGVFYAGITEILHNYGAREIRRSYAHSAVPTLDAKGFMIALGAPFRFIGEVNSAIEVAPKLYEYKYLRETLGMPEKQAAVLAREVNIDFQRHGSISKKWNKMTPFFDPALQSVDKLRRSTTKWDYEGNPYKALAKIFLYITIPSMMCWALYSDDDEYKQIPQYVKDHYWVFKVGSKWVKFPKPFEMGILFGSSVERALSHFSGKDQDAFKGMRKAIADSMLPSAIPTFILPWVEMKSNRDFYFDTPIVSPSKSKLPVAQQYNTSTSAVARWLGKQLDASPLHIEHLIRGYTGTVGVSTLRALDKFSGRQLPEMEWTEYMGVRSLMHTPGRQYESVERFYDYHQALERLHFGRIAGAREESLYSSFNKTRKKMTDLWKRKAEIMESTTISPKDKREMIDRLMKNINRYADREVERYYRIMKR